MCNATRAENLSGLGPFFINNHALYGAYGYLARSVITSLTRVVRSYAQVDILSLTLVGPNMTSPNKSTKKREIGSPNRPIRTNISANRTTVASGSKKPPHIGQISRVKQIVTAGAKAKPVTTTSSVLPTGPCTSKSALAQQSTAIQLTNTVSAGSPAIASSGTERWPLGRVVDSAKAGYQDRRNTARLIRRNVTQREEHELTRELKGAIERAKAIIPDLNPTFCP